MKTRKIVFFLSLILFYPSFLLAGNELPEISVGNQVIPDGATHQSEKIFRKQPPPANPSFDHAVFWYQIATLHQEAAKNTKRSGIVLKYCRVTGKDKNGTVVFQDNFEGNAMIAADFGGLYSRNPKWFAPENNDRHTPILQQMVTPDGLVMNVSSTPDKVAHWWAERFPYDTKLKYQMEMKVKIVGDVGLQIGGDYWKGVSSPHNGWEKDCKGKNNCEAFVSQWYGDTNGQFITIVKEI